MRERETKIGGESKLMVSIEQRGRATATQRRRKLKKPGRADSTTGYTCNIHIANVRSNVATIVLVSSVSDYTETQRVQYEHQAAATTASKNQLYPLRAD